MLEKESEVSTHQTNDIGAMLLEARIAKNLSVEDICNAIHLSEKQVQALESNDFSKLPEPVITRGFIRNYANFLGVEVEPLLKRYRSMVPQEERSIVVKANVNEVMSQHQHQPWLLYVLGSILVLLFLTAWFYYMDSVKTPEETSQEDVAAITETENLNQNFPEEIVTPIAPENTTTVEQATEASPNSVVQPSTPAIQQPLVAKPLEIHFSEDAWVRVKDKYGQIVLEKTATAGTVETLEAEPPFNIIIGNANAAKIKFYGQEVDLAPATFKNIIRLKLE
jgi:cytoskeleton protein RodZ